MIKYITKNKYVMKLTQYYLSGKVTAPNRWLIFKIKIYIIYLPRYFLNG